EAAAGEYVATQIVEPRTADGEQARITARFAESGTKNFADETLARGLDRGELQILFRSEMREESALRHLEIFGETSDRQPFQAFERGEIDGSFEDRCARPLSLHA